MLTVDTLPEGTRRAAARMLRRHTNDDSELASCWCDQFRPDEACVRFAADLDALTDIPAAGSRQLLVRSVGTWEPHHSYWSEAT